MLGGIVAEQVGFGLVSLFNGISTLQNRFKT